MAQAFTFATTLCRKLSIDGRGMQYLEPQNLSVLMAVHRWHSLPSLVQEISSPSPSPKFSPQ